MEVIVISDISFLLIFIIALALLFTLTNGLHDASSVIATLIASKGATPKRAVAFASLFGFLGVVFSGHLVGDAITGILNLEQEWNLLYVLVAGLLGALFWNLATWKLGIPSSSTHSLVGGLIGAALAYQGFSGVVWGIASDELSGVLKVLVSLLISPLIGFLLAFILQKLSNILFRNANIGLNKLLNRLEWLIGAILAFSHGANDSQKTIGLVGVAYLVAGVSGFAGTNGIPLSVRLLFGLMMFLGTAFGGWKIIKTLGYKIYDLKTIHSFNSMLSSSLSLLLANITGAPVSTTHVVVGSVVGVGAGDQYKLVNWHIFKDIVIAWLVTIPCSALLAGLFFILLSWRFI